MSRPRCPSARVKSSINKAMHAIFKMSLMKQREKIHSRRREEQIGLSGKIKGVAGNSSYDYFKIARRTTRVTAKKDGKTWFPKLVGVVLLLSPDIASVGEGVKCENEEVELTSGALPQQ